MPTTPVETSTFVLASQYSLRPDARALVFSGYVPPAPTPQPIGSTPLWCKATPTQSNDQIYFETSSGDAVFFPSFAIAQGSDGKPKVKFSQPNKALPDTTLSITLTPLPPTASQLAGNGGQAPKPALASYYADSSSRDSTVVQLNYLSGTQTLRFDEITAAANGDLVCVAKMTSYGDIQDVMGALVNGNSSATDRASLSVIRTLAVVGVAAGTTSPSTPPTVVSKPPLVFEGNVFRKAVLTTPVAPAHFMATENMARTVDLQTTRDQANLFRWRRGGPSRQTQPPPPPPPPATPLYFLLTNQHVVATIKSVWFLDTLHPEILADVTGVTASPGGYTQVLVPGYPNPLLRKMNDATSYYYLPDAFKIARRDTTPYFPLLNVTISGTTLDDARANVFFIALPVVDTVKLKAARDYIQSTNPGESFTLQSLPTPSGIHYGLYLPGATPFVSRAVPVALDDALSDSIDLSLNDFQTAFAALTAPISNYFQGKITVPVGDNIYVLPLIARADDFPGLYFEQSRSLDATNGTITLVLSNAVESAVQVDALPVAATRGGVAIPCTALFDPPLPATIAAASDDGTVGTLRVSIVPASGSLDAGVELVVDQSSCRVVPDASRLLRAIVDPNGPVKGSLPVTVVVPAVLFTGATADKNILTITMSFFSGNTIRFAPPSGPTVSLVASDKPGQVDLTVFDYVLHQAGSSGSAIQYKLAITYASGHTVNDGDWRTAPNDNFVLDLS